jgi:hypothetical protein
MSLLCYLKTLEQSLCPNKLFIVIDKEINYRDCRIVLRTLFLRSYRSVDYSSIEIEEIPSDGRVPQ